MTGNELLTIMRKEKIEPCYYKIYGVGGPIFEVVYHLKHKGNKYRLLITERAEKIYDKDFDTEDEACKNFLMEMSDVYPELKKYI